MRKKIRAIARKAKPQKKRSAIKQAIDLEQELWNQVFIQKRMQFFLRLKRLRKLRALAQLKRLRRKRHQRMLESFQELFDEQLNQLEKEYQLFMVWIDYPSSKKQGPDEETCKEKKRIKTVGADLRVGPVDVIEQGEEIKPSALSYQKTLFLLSKLSKEPDSVEARGQPRGSHST